LSPFVCKAQTIFWAFEYWQRDKSSPSSIDQSFTLLTTYSFLSSRLSC
jgi:hypothetical protein